MFNKNKIINDPLYGFLTIPTATVFDVIEHPFFQRLRRIRQLGMSELVYPGAVHTRFQHALGAMNLMIQCVQSLRAKNIAISDEEAEATYLGILLHDIGHGPYSHTLEHSIVQGVNHEKISDILMQKLNEEFDGKLDLAIDIFNFRYSQKPFLSQLISSQLDMDRLDYLLRDSFFTGVSEGVVGAERLINMLHVHQGQLVVEEKGIYSVEKFLVARRLMYWQVYMHKTVTAADQLLISILKRARDIASSGKALGSYHPLVHFLGTDINEANFDNEAVNTYTLLDDSDILNAVKSWTRSEDRILSTLCKHLLDRNLPKIKINTEPVSKRALEEEKIKAMNRFGLRNIEEASYFIHSGELANNAYKDDKEGILILRKNGETVDAAKASDNYNLGALTQTVTKYFTTYWK
jgi:HD superfamily phosphohydrolase